MLIYTNECQLWHFANWWIGKQRWNTTQEAGASLCCSPASAGRRWALACPLGIPREEASWEFFCGLPELKVNVRGEKTAGGEGSVPREAAVASLGEEEEGASLEPPSSFLLFPEWGSLTQ